MDEPKKHFLKNFDWKSFEQFFGAKLPQIPSDKLDNTNWIENYVQEALKQAFPRQPELSISSQKYNTEVFETHNNVIVKISIPDKPQAKKIRILVGANLVKLVNASGKLIQSIQLGTQVVKSSCKAVYKNGILQLHLRKQADDDHFQETFIRFHE